MLATAALVRASRGVQLSCCTEAHEDGIYNRVFSHEQTRVCAYRAPWHIIAPHIVTCFQHWLTDPCASTKARNTRHTGEPQRMSHCPAGTHQLTFAQAAPGVSFKKDYLYDGPWRVLWKTNTAWQRYFDPLKSVADNRAYQWYKEVLLGVVQVCESIRGRRKNTVRSRSCVLADWHWGRDRERFECRHETLPTATCLLLRVSSLACCSCRQEVGSSCLLPSIFC